MNKRQRKKLRTLDKKEMRKFLAGVEKRIKEGYDK